MNTEFFAPGWRERLATNGLAGFDPLWALAVGWFEPPNQRRGGWSGVSRFDLTLPDGSCEGLFIKRQENHATRTWRHPLRGEPTFAREFRLIERYRLAGVPTLEPVYFATAPGKGGARAILVTRELTGFRALSDCVDAWLRDGAPSRLERQAYLHAIARTLRRLHDAGISHGAFFPKHVFVRRTTRPPQSADAVEVRIIDLEKSRRRISRNQCAQRDLFSLIRHTREWSRSDRVGFFRAYVGEQRLSAASKRLWRALARRAGRKGRLGTPEQRLVARQP